MAQVELTDQAVAGFNNLPKRIQERIRGILYRLEQWPAVSGAKRLSGQWAAWHRIRTGDDRVRFRVAGNIVTVDKIGHRSKFYED
jgi:mRNA-degrading endonuclease RelE of RelBE toxin-antitoxin system